MTLSFLPQTHIREVNHRHRGPVFTETGTVHACS